MGVALHASRDPGAAGDARYWQGDYGDLVELAAKPAQGEEPADPELQLLAANAAYRVAQRGPQDKTTVLKNLDAAIRDYLEALRAGNERPDAAFNYELAVRIREELANGKRKGCRATTSKKTRARPTCTATPASRRRT